MRFKFWRMNRITPIQQKTLTPVTSFLTYLFNYNLCDSYIGSKFQVQKSLPAPYI